jgi:glycosyltransferase involved in cell wall biosynthesis
MRQGAKHDTQSLTERRIVRALPITDRGRWLVKFASLYREAVAAARAAPEAFGRYPWRIFPISWRVKMAMIAHVVTVHRYKERNDHLLVPAGADRPLLTFIDEPIDGGEDIAPSGCVLPAWAIDDLKSFSENEPSLWPDDDFVSGFQTYRPALRQAPGWLYFDIYSRIADANFEAVVIAPWLKRGGATKGTMQFLEYYSRYYRSILITTLDVDAPCRSNVPPGVELIEFGKLSKDLDDNDRVAVLTRLLLELGPTLIHVVNSDLGWRCLAEHGLALKSNRSRLVASAFAEEVTPSGRRIGYPITYLPTVEKYIDRVITDSEVYCKRLKRRYGVSTDQIHCVHFWHSIAPCLEKGNLVDVATEAPRVLFAGRLAYEKRPDLLYGIAAACKNFDFHIFGETQQNKFVAKWRRKLSTLPNVWLHGAYEDFRSIVERGNYRAFLYTTAFDGLPNVLLEAASHRIPIVAPPEIGGLADLIDAETAFTVDDGEEADSYTRALRLCIARPIEAKRRAQNAFDLVCAQHSREAFDAAMDIALAAKHDATRRPEPG